MIDAPMNDVLEAPVHATTRDVSAAPSGEDQRKNSIELREVAADRGLLVYRCDGLPRDTCAEHGADGASIDAIMPYLVHGIGYAPTNFAQGSTDGIESLE